MVAFRSRRLLPGVRRDLNEGISRSRELIRSRDAIGGSLRRSLAFALLVGAPFVGLRAQLASGEPVLQPGDAVRLQVWGMPEMSGEFEIDAAGRVLHPLYDSVKVTDVPMSVAQSRLASVLDQQRAGTQFTLQPLLRIAVEGEIASPNVVRYPPDVTIAQAIALAGGVTERGRIDRIRLVRGESVTTLDLRDPTSADLRIPIRSGDRIIVDRRGRTFSESVMPALSVVGTLASLANLFLGRRR